MMRSGHGHEFGADCNGALCPIRSKSFFHPLLPPLLGSFCISRLPHPFGVPHDTESHTFVLLSEAQIASWYQIFEPVALSGFFAVVHTLLLNWGFFLLQQFTI